jgi:hypothetical protein
MRKTGELICAYCRANFTCPYKTRSTTSLGLVVPKSVCGVVVPDDWYGDFVNSVLACRACNDCDHQDFSEILRGTLEAFFDLLDRTFAERFGPIAEKYADRHAVFGSRTLLCC